MSSITNEQSILLANLVYLKDEETENSKSIAEIIEHFSEKDYKALTAIENDEKRNGLPAQMNHQDWANIIDLIKKDDYLMSLSVDNVLDRSETTGMKNRTVAGHSKGEQI